MANISGEIGRSKQSETSLKTESRSCFLYCSTSPTNLFFREMMNMKTDLTKEGADYIHTDDDPDFDIVEDMLTFLHQEIADWLVYWNWGGKIDA